MDKSDAHKRYIVQQEDYFAPSWGIIDTSVGEYINSAHHVLFDKKGAQIIVNILNMWPYNDQSNVDEIIKAYLSGLQAGN